MPRTGTRRNKIYERDPVKAVLRYLKGVKGSKDWWYLSTLINSPKFAAYIDVVKERLSRPEFIAKLEAAESYDRVKIVGEEIKKAVEEYRALEEPEKVGESVLSAVETLSEEISKRREAIEKLIALIPT